MTWGIGNYSTTPGSNTGINGINIAPGCPSSSVGPALRQLMADIASALSAGQYVPAGATFWFPTNTAPTGYQALDGSAISRASNPALFALLNTTYGAGDGSTTFNVPDWRGRTPVGYDAGNATGRMTASTAQGLSANTVGNTGGEQAHTQTIGEVPAHNHTGATGSAGNHSHLSASGFNLSSNPQLSYAAGSNAVAGGGSEPTDTTPAHTHTISSQGGGAAFNVVQPSIVQLPCIKLG